MCKLDRVPALFEWNTLSSATLTHSSLIGHVGILILRGFGFLYTLSVLIASWVIYPNAKLEWLAWLTNWGQVATVAYFLFSFINTLVSPRTEPKLLAECRAVERASYLLFETAFSWNILIALMYWFTVFPYQPGVARIELIVKINVHFVNIVFLCIECLCSSIVFVPVHLMVVLGFLYFYAALNACYTSINGELFAILKWQTFGSVGVIMFITLFVVGAFYLGYAMHLIRKVIVAQFKLPQTPEPALDHMDDEDETLLSHHRKTRTLPVSYGNYA